MTTNRVDNPISPLPIYFNDPQSRISAYIATAIAIATLATLHGNIVVGSCIGGISLIFLGRDIYETVLDIKNLGLKQSTPKIFNLAQRIFAHGLIWGLMLSGMSLTLTWQGSKLLLQGTQMKDPILLLKALNSFAGFASIWAPLSHSILHKSDQFFYESKTLAEPIQQWIEAILQSIQTLSFQPIYSQMAIDSNYLSYLPVDISRDHIGARLQYLNNDQITSLIDRYPYLLDINFLQQRLTDIQFNTLVLPRLKLPAIDVKNINITQTWSSSEISQYENYVQAIEAWRLKLPKKNRKFQSFIDQVNSIELSPLKSHLATLRTNAPVEDLTLVLKERAGFSDADFKSLSALFPRKDTPSHLLAERGLRTLSDLQFFKILQSKDNSAEAVLQRLRHYLNCPQIPTKPVTLPNGRFNAIPWESIAHRIQVLGNYIFYYGITLSLLGLQYYSYPLSTTTGLAYGLFRKDRFYSLKKLMSWETVPDFTEQTLTERCRFIYQRTGATLFAFRFKAPGAFLTGIYLADTLRHYAGPHLTKLANKITGRPPEEMG